MDKVEESQQINGVLIQPLEQIEDNRGSVLHMIRNDGVLLKKFGEVYFSEIYPGQAKAWKRHKEQTQNLAVPVGAIRLVIYDDRQKSSTQGNLAELTVSRPNHYSLVQIPPMLWYGFQSLNKQTALIANCTDQPHNPLEVEILPQDSDRIPYQWDITK
jgi:dTDP-4-dehydrorhamnose 3,5-epimerase